MCEWNRWVGERDRFLGLFEVGQGVQSAQLHSFIEAHFLWSSPGGDTHPFIHTFTGPHHCRGCMAKPTVPRSATSTFYTFTGTHPSRGGRRLQLGQGVQRPAHLSVASRVYGPRPRRQLRPSRDEHLRAAALCPGARVGWVGFSFPHFSFPHFAQVCGQLGVVRGAVRCSAGC